MVVSLNIPEHARELLRGAYGEDLSRAALEAMALEGYRSGKLSRYAVQLLMGMDSVWDVEAWLAEHGAHLNYSLSDLAQVHREIRLLQFHVAEPILAESLKRHMACRHLPGSGPRRDDH